MGILGQHFGTPTQLLEHHPVEPWRFWDNVLDHHPNFWNTTPSSRGDSGTTFWNTTPTPPHRRRTPTGQGGGSAATFWNTTPSSRMATNQAARNTIYGEGSGATFGTPPHRAAGPRPREWDTFRLEPTCLRSPQEIIMSAPLFDESRPGRGKN